MLGFEIFKNGEKLALAGLSHSGVLHVTLMWVGRGIGASARAARSEGPIEGVELHVDGLDSSGPGPDVDLEWVGSSDICVGDEISVRVTSAQRADAPAKRNESEPASCSLGEATLIECSFCGAMRRAGPPPHVGGIAGPQVFACVRCVVFGERLLNDGSPVLLHLLHTADQPCSFCGTERSGDGFAARGSTMCRNCLELAVGRWA